MSLQLLAVVAVSIAAFVFFVAALANGFARQPFTTALYVGLTLTNGALAFMQAGFK